MERLHDKDSVYLPGIYYDMFLFSMKKCDLYKVYFDEKFTLSRCLQVILVTCGNTALI